MHQWLFSFKALLQKLPDNITTGLTFSVVYSSSGSLQWFTVVTSLVITKHNRKLKIFNFPTTLGLNKKPLSHLNAILVDACF